MTDLEVEQIERALERAVDRLDRALMTTDMTQQEYDARMAALYNKVDNAYARRHQ